MIYDMLFYQTVLQRVNQICSKSIRRTSFSIVLYILAVWTNSKTPLVIQGVATLSNPISFPTVKKISLKVKSSAAVNLTPFLYNALNSTPIRGHRETILLIYFEIPLLPTHKRRHGEPVCNNVLSCLSKISERLFHLNEVHVKMICRSLMALFLSLNQTEEQEKRQRKMLIPDDLLPVGAWLLYRVQVICCLFISEMRKWTLLFRRDNKRTNNHLQKVIPLRGGGWH